MFNQAYSFNQPIEFDLQSAKYLFAMFAGTSGLSSIYFDNFLKNLSNQDLIHNVKFKLPPNGRTTASDEVVKKLKEEFSWEFRD